MVVSLIVCIIGLIVYLAFNNKASEAGRIMFAFGLLAFLLTEKVGIWHF